jgi:hypothetical protein
MDSDEALEQYYKQANKPDSQQEHKNLISSSCCCFGCGL